MFPSRHLVKELIAFIERSDRGDLEENFSKMFGICASRVLPAPHEPLSLYMHKASLNDDIWPYRSEGTYGLRIPVNRAAFQAHTGGFERLEKRP